MVLRFRLRMDRKRQALLQAGIAIVLIILFIGALNSITYASRTSILTTEDIWKNADKVSVVISYSNSTMQSQKVYSLASIAAFYSNRLYISVPPPPSDLANGKVKHIDINLYNLNMTWNDLIAKGINYVRAFVYIHNTTAFGTSVKGIIGLGAVQGASSYTSWVSGGGLVEGFQIPVLLWYNYWGKYYTDVMGNGTLEKTTYLEKTIDTGALAVTIMMQGLSAARLSLFIGGHQLFDADYIVVELEVYAVSEKPVLKAITEPIYSLFAALYALLLAVINKIKQYVVSAFSGFAAQFTMTGLIGDPVVALIVVLFILTIIFIVARKRR